MVILMVFFVCDIIIMTADLKLVMFGLQDNISNNELFSNVKKKATFLK